MKQKTIKDNIEELNLWANSHEGTKVWTKGISDWALIDNPIFSHTYTYIVDNEDAPIRKKFADGEPVYVKLRHSGTHEVIVKFTDKDNGTVIVDSSNTNQNQHAYLLIPVLHNETWEYLPDYIEKTNITMTMQELFDELGIENGRLTLTSQPDEHQELVLIDYSHV